MSDDILTSFVETAKKTKKKNKKGKIPDNFKKSKKNNKKEKVVKSDKTTKKEKQGPPTKDSWWGSLSVEEQTEYLSQHPNSKKPQNGVKEAIGSLSDDAKKSVKVAVNNIIQNPDKAVKSAMGDFDPEKDMSSADKKKLEGHMSDVNKTASAYKKNPTKKNRKLLTGKTILAAGVILASAGILTLAVGDPSLAISSIIMLKHSKDLVKQFASFSKNKVLDLRKVTNSVTGSLSSELANKDKVKDAFTSL